MLPEHTVEAYKLAIDQGADVIECDVCLTKVCWLIFETAYACYEKDIEDFQLKLANVFNRILLLSSWHF